MRSRVIPFVACVLLAGLLGGWASVEGQEKAAAPATPAAIQMPATAEKPLDNTPIKPAEISSTVTKGVSWLIKAQHEDGGWGGGSHAQQDIRDPQKVQTDPATTAFTLLALLRAGQTPIEGDYQSPVRRGLEYLITAVEKAPAEGAAITTLTGTQPQSKLGQYVDTPLTAQYLSRAIGILPKDDPLYKRADVALDRCLAKIVTSQQSDGGWGKSGGWAPILQSSLCCSALEIAQANGKAVEESKLAAARDYQQQQVAVTPAAAGGARGPAKAAAKTDAAAGVELYAFNSSFRGNASEAREASEAIKLAIGNGALPYDSKVTVDNLQRAGQGRTRAEELVKAADQNAAQIARLDDEKLLAGFGNNGGEEYLSYLLTSESLVIAGGDKFHQWNDKMHGRLQKIQNTDGSWSGQHCITSPVFCTAAVVQCLTTDRDAKFLIAMAEKTKGAAGKDEKTESVANK